MKARFSKTQT